MKQLLLCLILTISFLLPGCQKFNTLVEKDENCEQAYADYEAQLQRRADMIPQLVEVAKATSAHESQTLKEVMEARASATQIKLTADDLTNPEKVAAFEKAQNQLKGSLSRLMMVQETYPELKANQSFQNLMVQIEGTENRILRSREQYNKAVGDYNKELKRIGGRIVNQNTGTEFKPRVYFKAEESAKAAPKVDFSTQKK